MLGYLNDGKGPALVLIHGVGLRAEAWEPMMPVLKQRFNVFAVDMPGHGASFLGQVVELQDYVDRLQSFVQALEQPVSLAGHSMGAILALKVAAQSDADVTGVAALNAIYRRSAEAQAAVTARARAISQGGKINNGPTLTRWFGRGPKGTIKSARDACETWLRTVDRQGYARAYAAFAAQDGPSDAELAAISCPALFMAGAGDLNSTPAMSEAMAKRTPQGCAINIEDAAHMMPMTHPDAVAEAIIETFQPGKAAT